MDDIIVFILITICSLGGLFIGKIMDPAWKVWLLRQVTKTDYHILAFASKDKKNIYRYAVNPEKDVIIHRGMLWVVEKGRIYREKKGDSGWLFSKAPKTSEEGVPIIYVDADSMRPMTFSEHEDPVKPSEAGTVLTAWIENQLQKGFEQRDKIFMVVCIVGGLVLVSMIIGYFNGTAIADTNARFYPIEVKLGIRYANGSLVETYTNQSPMQNGTIRIPT